MKHLHLQSSNYNYIEKSFKEWLDVLGYASRTVKGAPIQVREMLHYMEQKKMQHITQIKARHIREFIKHLAIRGKVNREGGLSTSSINSYITAINLFSQYLYKTGKYDLDVHPRYLQNQIGERTILTKKEIKSLYEATYEPHIKLNSVAMGQRDRAIIAIFYGCGLRREEGSNLDLNDIDLIKRTVLVKKGKGNKQRYVPIATKHSEDIRAYIEEGRYWFLQDNRSTWHARKGLKKQDTDAEAFFLNHSGKRMIYFDDRFEYLKEISGIETHFSAHSLRHSIATHLLQSGMPIEEIAKFLGHSSLESTQIYTHIVNQLTNETINQ